jgi:hypothetical protein
MPSLRTWARSYWARCPSQLSALPPKTFSRRTAISGEMLRSPFTNSDKVRARDALLEANASIIRDQRDEGASARQRRRYRFPKAAQHSFLRGPVCHGEFSEQRERNRTISDSFTPIG